jgi:hypothetical protein
MKFDLEKEGLETVLLPWQAELMRWIWSVNGEVDSRSAYVHLQGSTVPMSRATVINFLKDMAEEGFLEYREATTKGGWKRLYVPSKMVPDEEAFRKALTERIIEKIRRELMDNK